MRNFLSFNENSGKFNNVHFDGLFLSKVCNVSAKKIQIVSWKIIYGFKNDISSFNENSGKFNNVHFDGLFLSKVCNVSAKKIQIVSWKIIYGFKNDISSLVIR